MAFQLISIKGTASLHDAGESRSPVPALVLLSVP